MLKFSIFINLESKFLSSQQHYTIKLRINEKFSQKLKNSSHNQASERIRDHKKS